MILCLYCFQVLYSHAREARVVYSQTAKVTKLFVILPLGLVKVSEWYVEYRQYLSQCPVYENFSLSSACFFISSPESGFPFWPSSSSQCYLPWWQRNNGYTKLRFWNTSLGQCLLRDSMVCQRQSFKICSVRWSSYKPMCTFATSWISTWKSCNFIYFDIYIFLS